MFRLQCWKASWGFALGLALVTGAINPLRAGDKEDFSAASDRADAAYAKADYAAAAREYERALTLAERVFGPDGEKTGTSLNNLANSYANMGQYAQAEPLFQRSLKIKEARLGPDHPSVATSLNNLANLHMAMGQYAQAEPLYQRSLKIRQARLGPDHPDVAATLNNLAGLYKDMGQYAMAEPLYRRSLRIYETRLGPDHPLVATSLNNLAILYMDMGQYGMAEPLFRRSLEIVQAKLGQDHPLVADSLNNLANVYKEMSLYAQAEPLYQRSLKIYEAKLGPDHPLVADNLNNLANLYKNMGQYAQAEPLYGRSLRIRQARLGPDHPQVGESLNNLATLYTDMGQYAQAEPLYKRSLQIWEAHLGPEHPDVALALSNMAWLYQDMGQFDAAADWCDRARRVVRKHVARVLPALSERQQLEFLQHTDQAKYFSALTLGEKHMDDAVLVVRSYGWLVNGKALAQQSLAEQALLARDSHDSALAEQINWLRTVRSQLATLSQAMPKPGQEAAYRRQLVRLAGQEQELTRQVNLAAGRPALDEPWIEPAAVRKALADDAVLVDIVQFRPCIFESKGSEDHWQAARYAAWIVPAAGHGEIEIIDLGAADQIDQAVEAARQAIQQSAAKMKKADDEQQAQQSALQSLTKLAALILDPLKPHLAAARQLVLSPDSNLWLVPWGALPVEEGEYAIEAWQIRFVTSGRDLVAEQLAAGAPKRPQTKPKIFADPDYDLDGKGTLAATRAVLRGQETQLAMRAAAGLSESGLLKADRLPGTAIEAQSITPALEAYAHEAPTLYSERYALEGVLKLVASPKVLVLSTHGFYLSDQEVRRNGQGGVPAGGNGESRGAQSPASGRRRLENPLLSCGLLLAGCNKPSAAGVDDGVVTGMEIVGCDLRGTDLVVLSACETGLGQVRNGEGVAGLRQAFQLAGAKAVVSTLWRIPDKETASLMSDFFSNLAAGQSKAEALRSAQLALIKAHRHETGAAHPLYWAAFTVTGN